MAKRVEMYLNCNSTYAYEGMVQECGRYGAYGMYKEKSTALVVLLVYSYLYGEVRSS